MTSGPLNWLSQVASVAWFGLLGVPQRGGSVLAALFGVAGVVAVLVGILSMATGFKRVMAASGPPDAAIVLRSGADSEMVSGFSQAQARIIGDGPGIARGPDGPLASAELFVINNLSKRSTGTEANVPVRGVQSPAFLVRNGFKMVAGRPFAWGRNEVIAGVGAARAFAGLEVGGRMKVGSSEWPVTGVFSAGGSDAESEVWTDAAVLQQAYHRGNSFQSVRLRLASPAAFQAFKDALTTDPRLDVTVERESDFYAAHSSEVDTLITTLGYLVASLMAIGAAFGALNTMYGSVSSRSREIATLRALGFGQTAIVTAVMLESAILALVGGAAGAGAAYLLFNGVHASTINWQSFSQVAFSFSVTFRLLVEGILWAAAIGLVGGLLPAVRAARLPIAAALREP